jgi:hypothetical protein
VVNGRDRRSDEITREVGMAESVSRIPPRFGRLGRLGGELRRSAVHGFGVLRGHRIRTVNISGAGTISCSGDASVNESISGFGQLIKR